MINLKLSFGLFEGKMKGSRDRFVLAEFTFTEVH